MGYKFRQFEIPDYMTEGLTLYIEHGILSGGFLTAVLENDLMKALGLADDTNLEALPAYGAYLYNEAPASCYGSKQKVSNWVILKQTERESKT